MKTRAVEAARAARDRVRQVRRRARGWMGQAAEIAGAGLIVLAGWSIAEPAGMVLAGAYLILLGNDPRDGGPNGHDR